MVENFFYAILKTLCSLNRYSTVTRIRIKISLAVEYIKYKFFDNLKFVYAFEFVVYPCLQYYLRLITPNKGKFPRGGPGKVVSII